jgi:hypothetical protein
LLDVEGYHIERGIVLESDPRYLEIVFGLSGEGFRQVKIAFHKALFLHVLPW